MDTRVGREIRLKIYAFLAKHLKPDRPIEKLEDLPIAAY